MTTYEAFAIDEACAYVLGVEQANQLEELRNQRTHGEDAPEVNPPTMAELLESDEFREED